MVFWCGSQTGFGMMWYGWFFWIIVLVGIFLLVLWILNQNKGKFSGKEDPQEILKNRLAKGEISKEEYHKLRKELE